MQTLWRTQSEKGTNTTTTTYIGADPSPLNDSISNKVTQSSVSFKQFHSSAQLSQFKLKGRIVIPQHTVIQYMLIYVL